MSDDICGVCNGAAPPSKNKGRKKKAQQVKWICCDSCVIWFHAICVRISDTQMENASNYMYLCESCSIRGCLIKKPQSDAAVTSDHPLGKTVLELTSKIAKLQTELQELSSSISKLQAELDATKVTSQKQFDRLRSRLNDINRASDRDEAHNRFVNNLTDKLQIIETGAKLANGCFQAVNSCRLAINKLPFNEGENVQALVKSILHFLGSQNELPHVTSCFRLPVKPSKWADRSITPTVVVCFDSTESRQNVLRKYFEKYRQAKLCNLNGGPSLEYRFTINEVLSLPTFRIRNYALRLKQTKVLKSVFVKNDRVSVLFPNQERYLPIDSVQQLHELAGNASVTGDSSSIFFDAMSADISTSSQR